MNEPTNTTGRVDLAMERIAQYACARVEDRMGVDLWNNGLGECVKAALGESPFNNRVISARDILCELGLLPRRQNVRA